MITQLSREWLLSTQCSNWYSFFPVSCCPGDLVLSGVDGSVVGQLIGDGLPTRYQPLNTTTNFNEASWPVFGGVGDNEFLYRIPFSFPTPWLIGKTVGTGSNVSLVMGGEVYCPEFVTSLQYFSINNELQPHPRDTWSLTCDARKYIYAYWCYT